MISLAHGLALSLYIFVLGKTFFILAPEENKIAETFRTTLINDQNSLKFIKSSSKMWNITYTFLYTCLI